MKSFKKAREAAREHPIPELVKECKEFMDQSAKRISKLQAELDAEVVLLQESRACLARLEAQQTATPATLAGTRATSGEFVADGEPAESRAEGQDFMEWDAFPDVTSIPPLPEDHQARGVGDAISFVSNLLAQRVAELAVRRASALALHSMKVQTYLGSRMVAFIDEAAAKRREGIDFF